MNPAEVTFISFAPCRSGHHAVLVWMMLELSKHGKVAFYNNLRYNPFCQKVGDNAVIGSSYQEFENGEEVVKYREPDGDITMPVTDDARYRFFSFEEKDFRKGHTEISASRFVSGQVRYIITIRDPYNWAASWLKFRFRKKFEDASRIWLDIANEMLGRTAYLPRDTIKVNYNRWKSEPGYRQWLAKTLGVDEVSDAGLDRISPAGCGSSFDSLPPDARASTLSTDRRWLLMRHSLQWKQFINVMIDDISRRLFGFDLQDLVEKEGVGRDEGPYHMIQHPREDPINPGNSPERVNEFVEFLKTTPLGDYEWHTKAPFTPDMELVPGYEHSLRGRFHGRGVVICAGGGKYMPLAWVLVNQIRNLGCQLPIQIWYKDNAFGCEAPHHYQAPFLEKFDDVAFVDATAVRQHVPMRGWGGWEMKSFSIANSNLKEVIYLDADNIPLIDITTLLESPDYERTGALFWPDRGKFMVDRPFHHHMDIPFVKGMPEWESGQMVIDKERHWQPLQLAVWMNAWSDWWYKHFHGDKETFHLAWRKLGSSYTMHPPMKDLTGWDCICQHDMNGNRIFQHRSGAKYNFERNKEIRGFIGQEQHLEFLQEYHRKVLERGPLIR